MDDTPAAFLAATSPCWRCLPIAALAALFSGAFAHPSFGQTAPTWNGSVRCEIDSKGPGYISHLTHTWALTGAVPADGGMLDYPATWTVSGEGSRQPTETWPSAATWKTKGSAPGVRMAIYVRQSDKRLIVFLRNEQLSAPNATTGTEQTAGTATIRSRLQPISNAVYEWRPFPTIQDAPTSMHITGSSTTPLSRLDATQPLGTSGQAICTWDLVQGSGRAVTSSASGGAAGAASSANAAGGAVSTTDIANRVPARVAAIAPRTITLTGFTATGLSTTVSPRTIALAGFTASGPASAVAPRTIALAGFSARGTPAIAPRTIALTGFTAAGTASAVAPRTIALAGFTASGTAAVVGPRTIPLSGFTATGSTSTVAPRTIPLAGWTSAGP